MKCFKLLFAAVAVCCFGAMNAQKYNLKYNLAAGAKWIAQQTTQQNVNQQIMGMVNDMKITLDANTSYVVDKVEGDNYYMTFSYDGMKMKIESPFINLTYDSSQPTQAANPLNNALGCVVGEKFTFVMTNKGKVLSMTGFEHILDKMKQTMGGNQAMAEQVAAGLKQQFSDEAIKGSIEMSTALFPASEVAIGDSWTIETLLPITAEMKNISIITLKDVKDGKWYVEGKSTLTSNKDAAMQLNGMTQHMDLTGISTFQSVLNATTGFVQESKVQMNIDGKVVMEGGQLPAAMEIPMKIEGTTTMQVM